MKLIRGEEMAFNRMLTEATEVNIPIMGTELTATITKREALKIKGILEVNKYRFTHTLVDYEDGEKIMFLDGIEES